MKSPVKQIIVLFFLFLLSSNLLADQTDSLQTLINGSEGEQKIAYQIQLIKIFRESQNYTDALDLCFESLDDAIEDNNNKAQAELYNLIGKNLISDYREIEARDYLDKSIEVALLINNPQIVSESNFDLARTYFYQRSYDTAIYYYKNSIENSSLNDLSLCESKAYDWLGELYMDIGIIDSALYSYSQVIEVLSGDESVEANEQKARVLNALGNIYSETGDYEKAITAYDNSQALRMGLKDGHGAALCIVNIGNQYFNKGEYEQANGLYQDALKVFESLENKEGIANCYSKIGLIYQSFVRDDFDYENNLLNYQKAKDYHNMSLNLYREFSEERNGKNGVSIELGNLANVELSIMANEYFKLYGEFWEDSIYSMNSEEINRSTKVIIDLLNESYDIRVDLNDYPGIATALNQLGKIRIYSGDLKVAEKNLLESLEMAEQLKNNKLIMYNYYSLGMLNYFSKNYNKAIEYLNKTLEVGQTTAMLGILGQAHYKLSRVYEIIGNARLSLIQFKKYAELKDHQFSENSQKVIMEMQTKYETDKKEQEIKLLNNEKELQESVIKRQNMVLGFFVLGFLIVAVFVILLKRQINAKQRAYKELEEKNELISDQKREIEDSIHYASRIQRAVVPSPELAEKLLPEHFILWRPRDIVSGDFYWFTKVGQKLIIVAADCTGHGVPGAFMSMLGVSFLSEIVGKHGKNVQANLILNSLRSNVKRTLKQEGKKDEAKDGMDIALCIVDQENMTMQFAGAYNPLYMFRNGEMEVFKADKMPIGIHIFEKDCFTLQEIEIKKGDTFYIFSDGFVDQFGGPTGRKFMVKRFKALLEEVQELPMADQKKRLDLELDDWMGSEYLQIDDILVIGFRV